MANTLLIQLTNEKAAGLIHELEELNLIKILDQDKMLIKTKLSDKYKGIISKEKGAELNNHIKQMRNEWSNF